MNELTVASSLAGASAADGSYCLVLLRDKNGESWQVLLLGEREGRWKLWVHRTLTDQAGHEPLLRYWPCGEFGILSIESQQGRGTGVVLRTNAFLRVAPDEVVELFEYPVQGHVVEWEPLFDRYITSRVIQQPNELKAGATFEAVITVQFTGGEKHLSVPLFQVEKHLTLRWDPVSKGFTAAGFSQVTPAEAATLFSAESQTFVSDHIEQLVARLERGDSLLRRWAVEYTDGAPASEEVARLKRCLRS